MNTDTTDLDFRDKLMFHFGELTYLYQNNNNMLIRSQLAAKLNAIEVLLMPFQFTS